MIELEQQLIMAKQRYRESSEEAEELRVQLNDHIMQVEEYREKVQFYCFPKIVVF